MIKRAFSVLGTLASRLARGKWTRFTIFAGTHSAADAWLAMAAIFGRAPLLEGPETAEYERRFANAVGASHAFSFAAGRMALYAILEALGVGPGDEVILPAFTCVVVPNAILYLGARPIYVDIEPDTYNINPLLVEERITPRTKAILAQHTFGLLCDVVALKAIGKRHGIPVIEDAAHALGATLAGQPAGSLADAAFFSTDLTKVVSTGTGGMATTNDDRLAARLAEIHAGCALPPAGKVRRALAAYVSATLLFQPRVAVIGRYLHTLLWFAGLRDGFYLDEMQTERPTTYPYPARMPVAQARIGIRQLQALPANLEWRRRCARIYAAAAAGKGGPEVGDRTDHVFLRFTFDTADRSAWQRLFDDRLDMGVWFTSVVHGRSENFDAIGYRIGSCPVAEAAARNCVNLPTHPRVIAPEMLATTLASAATAGTPALAPRRVMIP